MNDPKFEPSVSLPTCDLCGASTIVFTFGHHREGYEDMQRFKITFACGAKWIAPGYAGDSKFPDNAYTRCTSNLAWVEDGNGTRCGNRDEVIRRMRAGEKT